MLNQNIVYLESIIRHLRAGEGIEEINFNSLYHYSQSSDETIRWTLAEILAFDTSKKGQHCLLNLMRDHHWIVRCEVYESLENHPSKKIVEQLFHAVLIESDEVACTYLVTSFSEVFKKCYQGLKNKEDYLKAILVNWFHSLPFIHTKLTIAELLYNEGIKTYRSFIEKIAISAEEQHYYAQIILEVRLKGEHINGEIDD